MTCRVLRHSRTATTTDIYMQEIPEGVRGTIDSIHRELMKSPKSKAPGSRTKTKYPGPSVKRWGSEAEKPESREATRFRRGGAQANLEPLCSRVLKNATKPGEAEPLSC
jgi:hypothetical protein